MTMKTTYAALAVLLTTMAFAQERVSKLETIPVTWRNAGPGGGGWVPSMLLSRHDPNRFWVGCDVGGIYLSENGGRTYETRNQGLRNLYVASICEHPTNPDLVLVGSWGGIFRTTDRARTWQEARTGLPPAEGATWGVAIEQIVNVPSRADSFWAISGSRGKSLAKLYRSDDAGCSWRQVIREGQFPEKTFFRFLSPDPRDEKILLLSTSTGLYRSEDGGATWKPSNEGLGHTRTYILARAPSNPDILYVSLVHASGETPWRSQPYRSEDGGRTWKSCGQNGLEMIVGETGGTWGFTSSYKWIAIHPENPNEVYLCGATWRCEGVWKSTDAGQSWRHVFTKNHVENGRAWLVKWGPDIHSYTISPFKPYAMAFGTEGYVYRTEDSGETWSQRYTDDAKPQVGATVGYETTCVRKIQGDPHHKGRFYFNYMDIGCQRTDDNGRSFRWCMKNIDWGDCFGIQFDAKVPDHIWGSFGQWGAARAGGCLAESFDGGDNWKLLNGEGWGKVKANGFAVVGENAPCTIYATIVDRGLVRTRDGGKTWQEVATNELALARVASGLRLIEGTLHFTVAGKIYSWKPGEMEKCLFAEAVGSVMGYARKGNRLLVAARSNWSKGKFFPGGAWLSNDAGANWKRVYSDPYVVAPTILDDYLVISPYDNPYHDHDNGGGVLVSSDGGATWKTLNSPSLFNWNLTCYGTDPFDSKVLWAGSHGNSAFVTRLPDAP